MNYSEGQAHANGDCWAPTCPACEYEDSLMPRLIVDTTADGDEAIWDQKGTKPTVVLYGYDCDDEDLWAAIKQLVEAGDVA